MVQLGRQGEEADAAQVQGQDGYAPGSHGASLCLVAESEGKAHAEGSPFGQKERNSGAQFESCPDKGRCRSID